MEKKVLLVDFDPQGNASTGLGIYGKDREKNIYRAISLRESFDKSIIQTYIPNLDLLASTIDLAALESELYALPNKEVFLKKELIVLQEMYDYILIDSAPSLGLLTLNALTASCSVLVPIQAEFFAMEGLVHLLNTIYLVQKSLNAELYMEGILLTMSDRRNNLSSQVETELRNEMKELVYKTVIPRNIKLSESSSYGKPGVIYDSKCLGSIAYIFFVQELLKNQEMRRKYEK